LAYQLGVFIGDVITVTPPESLLLPPGEIPQTKKLTIQDVIRTGIQLIDSSLIMYANNGDGALFKNVVSTEKHLEVFMPNQMSLDEVTSYLKKNKFEFSTWIDRNSALFYSLAMEKKLITFFLIIAFLIGSFSMVSILILLSTQKKQEIGVMLSLGISSAKVKKIFAHIGFIISMASVIVGLVAGILICLFLDNTSWIQLPDIYYDRSLPIKFDLSFYLGILFLSLVVSCVSSYFPSRYLIRFSPQDIIRKK
jgi:ABC-type lipoprotein release transport system permease subunit